MASICLGLCAPSLSTAQTRDKNLDRFTEFEQSLDTIAKLSNANTRLTQDKLEQLRKLVRSPSELAVLNTYKCEFSRLNRQLSEIDSVIQELNESITKHLENYDLRTALELCSYAKATDSSAQAFHVSKAYQFARFAQSASLRFFTSNMYIELTATQGRASDAVTAAQIALAIADANDDSFRKSLALRAMAAIELDYGDKEAALDYINQTIELSQTIPNRQNEIYYRFNRASVILAMKRLLEARSAVKAAEDFAKEVTKNIPQELISPEIKVLQLANAAELAYLEADYPQAKKLASEMRNIGKQANLPLLVAGADVGFALATVRQGNDSVLETHFKPAIQTFVEQKRAVEVRDAYENMAEALASIGKYKEAYYWRKEKDNYNQNLARESRNLRSAELRESNQAKQREEENTALKALTNKQQAEVESAHLRLQRWWLLAIVLAMGLAWAAQLTWLTKRRNAALQDINKRLDDQGSHDALTGLGNRRYLMQHQAELWRTTLERAKFGAHSALLLIDADHFKHINDQYGHAAGDAALIAIAQRLKACLRESDACVRWGGEEFLVYLEQCDHSSIAALCTRIMQSIRGTDLVHDGAKISLAVSIGYLLLPINIEPTQVQGQEQGQASATATASAYTLEDCFKLVDATLYLAKRLGRNRAVGLHAIHAHCREKQLLFKELEPAWQAHELDLVITEGPLKKPVLQTVNAA
ncbi:GGDEF domain-containing protein [Undibacterium cyanobacteriorum]|uniref:diguanylate cyclase n=1 Tax=Undibacterium cyanobacteriorum TaxID=3073561 RepID=A0ABY9RGB7_9BURK|nr:GGDEF domain-containing protein [Undibacterium sp. 20NA77.5]WMW79909.1 GGDEF domain-containing protein [Undibacterium sp. 20NA77.5]